MLTRGTAKGVLAGLCIALGGGVFLACDSRYVGAALFSVALLSICQFGFSLYTGKIGGIVENHARADVAALLTGLLGNLIGCLIFGWLFSAGLPGLTDRAREICAAKLGQSVPQALIRGYFCGVLMYVAVWIYRVKHSVVGILICIPTFILSGFEHSIADMFYFTVAGSFSVETLGYIALIIIGNSLGGVSIPLLEKLAGEKQHA